MTVPDYQTLMLPVLRAIADGQHHRLVDVRTVLAEQLGLTDEDRALKIPSGSPVFDSRVHWAVTYMAQLVSFGDRGARSFSSPCVDKRS